MATPKSIRVGANVFHGGQEAENGITRVIDVNALIGDIVTSDSTVQNKVIRGAANALPVGVVVTKELDGLGSVQSFENVQVVALTGTAIYGVAGLTGNGDGTAKLVAAETAGSLKVDVLGSQVIGGVTYIALYRL
jgi:3-dehydroquinate synthase class II